MGMLRHIVCGVVTANWYNTKAFEAIYRTARDLDGDV